MLILSLGVGRENRRNRSRAPEKMSARQVYEKLARVKFGALQKK